MRLMTLSCLATLLAWPAVAQDASFEEAAEAMTQTYEEAWKSGDAGSAASLYSEDATFVDFTGAVLEGRPAIEESLTDAFSRFQGSTIEITRTNLHEITPEIVVTDGTWEISGGPAGESPGRTGQYTLILQKSGDEWHIVSQQNKVPQERPSN